MRYRFSLPDVPTDVGTLSMDRAPLPLEEFVFNEKIFHVIDGRSFRTKMVRGDTPGVETRVLVGKGESPEPQLIFGVPDVIAPSPRFAGVADGRRHEAAEQPWMTGKMRGAIDAEAKMSGVVGHVLRGMSLREEGQGGRRAHPGGQGQSETEGIGTRSAEPAPPATPPPARQQPASRRKGKGR